MPADSLLLLLFFFLAVAGGWFAARYVDARRRRRQGGPGLNPGYVKGLNYLLDDNHDKAIEVFISMMEVDNETVETHFALGSLFRRRGEVDRAIRIHQNLIARPNLGKAHRDQALFALADDYLRAGLLDRAEALFEKLAENPDKRAAALDKLVTIYEQEHDWDKAAAARRSLPADHPQHRPQVISHYHCELAREALAKCDYVTARQELKRSQQGGPWLLRGALMRAHIAQVENDTKTAARLYKRAVEHDGAFLTEVWPALREVCEPGDGRASFARYLETLLRKQPAMAAEIAHAAIVHEDLSGEPVRRCVADFMVANRTLREAIGHMGLLDADGRLPDAALDGVAAGLRVLLRNRAAYKCVECGYASDQLYWQCPGCKNWDTVRPNTRIPEKRLALAADK